MKLRYEACDGFSKLIEVNAEQAEEELKGHEMTPYYAVSFDGISTLAPADEEAESWWAARFRRLMSELTA